MAALQKIRSKGAILLLVVGLALGHKKRYKCRQYERKAFHHSTLTVIWWSVEK